MPADATYEVSAAYLGGHTRAAAGIHLFEPAKAKVSAPTREVLERPEAKSWWPREPFEEFLGAIEAQKPGSVREVALLASHQQMARIVKPLIKVTLAAFGGSPASLLSRISTFAGVGLRGLTFVWKQTAPASGSLTIDWPVAVPGYVGQIWYGMFDVGFSMSKPGTVSGEVFEPKRQVFQLSWTP